jgi:hypothetical protein
VSGKCTEKAKTGEHTTMRHAWRFRLDPYRIMNVEGTSTVVRAFGPYEANVLRHISIVLM